MKKNNHKKGFSVLFATLIGSLVLAIGLAILSITIKQIKLSSAGRESQHAFYAADTGIECALYLDNLKIENEFSCDYGTFPNSSGQGVCSIGSLPFMCLGKTLNLDQSLGETDSLKVVVADSDSATTQISIGEGDTLDDDICFDVYVTKTNENGILHTEIESRGYSNCKESSSNRFERAIRVRY